jgi:hypothetical protein
MKDGKSYETPAMLEISTTKLTAIQNIILGNLKKKQMLPNPGS